MYEHKVGDYSSLLSEFGLTAEESDFATLLDVMSAQGWELFQIDPGGPVMEEGCPPAGLSDRQFSKWLKGRFWFHRPPIYMYRRVKQ